MSTSLLRLFSRAHYWVNKYILNRECMGASTNRTTSFFFRLFLGEKQFTRSSSLYFRVLHGANIAVRVAFDHHRAFQRRKQADSSWRERCRLPACRVYVNSLFLALTIHISPSFCPLTLVIPLAGKHWTTIYWSKNQNWIYSYPLACNTDCVWRSGSLKKARPSPGFQVCRKYEALG